MPPATRLGLTATLMKVGEKDRQTRDNAICSLAEQDLSPLVTEAVVPVATVAASGGRPKGKAQRNLTDSDSRIMRTGNGFMQGYNAQCVVDDTAQVIVAQAVTNQAPDAEWS